MARLPRHRARPSTRLARVQLRWPRRRRYDDAARASPRQIPAAIRARYDLVSFDPRGTGQLATGRVRRRRHRRPAERGRSHPELRRRAAVVLRRHARAGRSRGPLRRPQRRRGWRSSGAATSPATSIASAARCGDDKLNYIGFSYGTVIGAVYAQMFPDRVGAMVLDSPVDLSADAARGAARELRGLRAGPRRLPRRLRRASASCLVPQRRRSLRRARPLETRFEQGLSLPTPTPSPGRPAKRRAGVADLLHRAHLRALRQAVRLAVPRRCARPTPAKGDGTYLQYLADSTTGVATTGPTTTSTRSSASSSATTATTRPRRSTSTAPSTTASWRRTRSSAATSAARRSGATPGSRGPPPTETLGDVRVRAPRRSSSWEPRATRPRPYAGAQDLVVAPRRFTAAHVRRAPSTRRTRRAAASTRASTRTCSAARCPPTARRCRA